MPDWFGNPATKGTYYCSATLAPTAGGTTLQVQANSPKRNGKATYQCSSTGVWSAYPMSGYTCDGAVVQTKVVSTVTTTCADYVDDVRKMVIRWFKEDLKRCPGVDGLDWWVAQYKNSTNTNCPTGAHTLAKETCYRSEFRNAANQNGNSYNEAQYLGHISSFDEKHLCQDRSTFEQLAYPWTSPGVDGYGTSCKYPF